MRPAKASMTKATWTEPRHVATHVTVRDPPLIPRSPAQRVTRSTLQRAAGHADAHAESHGMGFLGELIERPVNEKAVMLIVAGWPAADAMVPAIHRKPLEEIATFL